MNLSRIRSFASLATLAVLAVAVTFAPGCSDDDNGPVAPASTSKLMVVHASPDAPNVDVLVDNAIVATDVPFGVNSAYLAPNSGTRNIKIRVTGTTTTVIDANLTLAANQAYSAFAVDSVSKISALVLTDNLAMPATGKAHVRFVHLSPNAPAVDVAVTGGPVLFANKAFKEYTDFTPVDAGTYNLEVRLAGESTVVLPLPNITLNAGKIYTVWASGFVGGTGDQALGAKIIVNNN
jgi:hypothetical protein